MRIFFLTNCSEKKTNRFSLPLIFFQSLKRKYVLGKEGKLQGP